MLSDLLSHFLRITLFVHGVGHSTYVIIYTQELFLTQFRSTRVVEILNCFVLSSNSRFYKMNMHGKYSLI